MEYVPTDLTAGKPPGTGGCTNTGTGLIIWLPAVFLRSLLPVSVHRDGCIRVLGFRLLAPQGVATSLMPADAAAAVCDYEDVAASLVLSVAAAAVRICADVAAPIKPAFAAAANCTKTLRRLVRRLLRQQQRELQGVAASRVLTVAAAAVSRRCGVPEASCFGSGKLSWCDVAAS